MTNSAPSAITAYDDPPDNPALSDVVERNIRAILKLRAHSALQRTLQERIADWITATSGRMAFVYLHAGWFASWLLLNTGRFGIRPFDPYPYGLLTMIVSLEAIFLSTFVLISQNRLSEESDRRADLEPVLRGCAEIRGWAGEDAVLPEHGPGTVLYPGGV